VTNHSSEVLVVGGGIIGLACAYYMAGEGMNVRILEKGRVGEGASHGNCGLLFFSDLPPLCGPGIVRKELPRVFRKDSPLHVRVGVDASRYLWLLRFTGRCNRFHFLRALKARERLLFLSRCLFHELMEEEDLDCGWERRGVLLAHMDRADMEGYGEISALLKPYGAHAEHIPKSLLPSLEPALGENVCGAWRHGLDSHVRPEKLVEALKAVVIEKGVSVEEGCPVLGFSQRNGRIHRVLTPRGSWAAENIVLAAGAWTPILAKMLSLRLPVQPGKGYSVTMERPEACPVIPCYFSERRVVATPWRDGLRLGGILEFSGHNLRMAGPRIRGLREAAAAYLRTPLSSRVVEEWTGMRPMSPDDLPVIGRSSRITNLIIATGHGILGLTTAAGTGRLVSRMARDQQTEIDARPFSPDRF